jgi:ketosteroid isomerase-like protein
MRATAIGLNAIIVAISSLTLLGACEQIRTRKAPEVEAGRSIAADEKELVDATRRINQAFVRGDLGTLESHIRQDFTMLHGHMKRIENKSEAVAEWKQLFAVRGASGLTYYIKESAFKVQLYGDTAVVTFNYEHPRLEKGRLGTETGKAVYVFLRDGGRWLMVHCSTIQNVAGGHGGGMT